MTYIESHSTSTPLYSPSLFHSHFVHRLALVFVCEVVCVCVCVCVCFFLGTHQPFAVFAGHLVYQTQKYLKIYICICNHPMADMVRFIIMCFPFGNC
jgi:hypothetical protein